MFPVAIAGSTILLITIIFVIYLMIETLSASDFNSLKVPAASVIDETYSFTFSNKTGRDEVIYRHLTDKNNTTIASKFSHPNTNGSDSREFKTLITNNDIVISWWDQNLTADEVMNSTNPPNGVTLGVILLKLPNENVTCAN
jgi:hypothetical protein